MLINLFPHPVLKKHLDIDGGQLLDKLKKEKFDYNKDIYPFKNKHSYSGTNYKILNKYKVLKNKILQVLKSYCNEVLHINNEMNIFSSWLTKHSPNGNSSYHYHANSFISGVYYPVGNNGFKINFLNPFQKNFNTAPNKFTIENSDSWEFEAEDNMLIIFPSYLRHCVLENTSNVDRYSIAFNCLPKGKFGTGDGYYEW